MTPGGTVDVAIDVCRDAKSGQVALESRTTAESVITVVPALGILQDGRTYFHYHHTAADTLDKIVPSELRENAAAMAVMGYGLASMKEPLPR